MPEDEDARVAPFRIDVEETQLVDLRERLASTRWAPASQDEDWVRGVPLDYLRGLTDYWAHHHDWRAQEADLNAVPQFTTTIDGQRLHFLHARSVVADATPLLITHGWPGSVVEFLDIIGPLTDPERHGGRPEDAFHVVAPSIPGFAFSSPLQGTGWTVTRIAETFAALMRRLGYDRYVAQGGDWGSMISREIGVVDAAHVLGVHLNMLYVTGEQPADLSDDDRDRLATADYYRRELSGYNKEQSTRPQTLAYALTDSPVGQLAWIVEKFKDWTDSSARPENAVDRDRMLANVMLYWLTSTAGSSAEIYFESQHDRRVTPISSTPTGVAVFPHDIHRPIRRMAEQDNDIVHWTEMPRGGHFAAMEEPDLFVDDVRAFVRRLVSDAPR